MLDLPDCIVNIYLYFLYNPPSKHRISIDFGAQQRELSFYFDVLKPILVFEFEQSKQILSMLLISTNKHDFSNFSRNGKMNSRDSSPRQNTYSQLSCHGAQSTLGWSNTEIVIPLIFLEFVIWLLLGCPQVILKSYLHINSLLANLWRWAEPMKIGIAMRVCQNLDTFRQLYLISRRDLFLLCLTRMQLSALMNSAPRVFPNVNIKQLLLL